MTKHATPLNSVLMEADAYEILREKWGIVEHAQCLLLECLPVQLHPHIKVQYASNTSVILAARSSTWLMKYKMLQEEILSYYRKAPAFCGVGNIKIEVVTTLFERPEMPKSKGEEQKAMMLAALEQMPETRDPNLAAALERLADQLLATD